MLFNKLVVLALMATITGAADYVHEEAPRVRGGEMARAKRVRTVEKPVEGDVVHGHKSVVDVTATPVQQERRLERVGVTIGLPGFPTYTRRFDDMGMRFSKVTFDEGEEPENAGDLLPLTINDFPLSPAMAAFLRQSRCISVVTHEDCMECDMYTEDLIEAVGGFPLHVSTDPESPFWEEFREVLRVQKQRVTGVNPYSVLPIPDIWVVDGLNLDIVAEHVHDELPGTHHANLIRQFIREGFTVDKDIIPSNSSTEFLRREVMLSYLTTWAVNKVGPYNFACKYNVGRSRPEEVAWKIAQGVLTQNNGVPVDIVRDIMDLNLESQFNFTAYPEGSPAHPSWPAMHSAGSAASLWLPVVIHLNPQQLCQTKLVDWVVSYARTVAGVHYPSDNIAGLDLGQEIMARKLPGHLEAVFGSDPEVVAAKIETLRFNWTDFKESDCFNAHFDEPNRG